MNVPAVGGKSNRALAHYLLNTHQFQSSSALNENRQHLADLQAVRDRLQRQLMPLKATEPTLDGSDCGELRKYLRIIGASVRPDFSPAQASAWMDAVVLKLADLPGVSLCRAAGEALHGAYQFVTEAEARIRQLAEADRDKYQRAVRRADALQAEILRSRDASRQIEDGTTRGPMDTPEVHELQRKGELGRRIVRMGLAGGWITPEQLLPPEELPTKED